ncbi:MAG: hypothetical protein QUT27_14620 [candidate division Zixibacteria bacterium]|nr:hypothetical protein [candidate division Zixibacteria bacterium]
METTLNVHVDILKQISKLAALKGISQSKTIILLFKSVMNDMPDSARLGILVRYQNRHKPESWHTFHLTLKSDDYEYIHDLKKLLKMSVSLILSYAVEKYLPQILRMKKTDNYRFQNYIVIKEVIEDLISWRFIWGFPLHIENLFSH